MSTPAGTPTKLFMNWVGVTVTPLGGTAIAITGVTAVRPMRSNKVVSFFGDNFQYARVKKGVERERGIQISTGDLKTAMQIPEDTPCTITATLLDPRNQANPGGGGILVTLVNAILEKGDGEGENNKFAGGQIVFTAFGATDNNGNEADPLTITPL